MKRYFVQRNHVPPYLELWTTIRDYDDLDLAEREAARLREVLTRTAEGVKRYGGQVEVRVVDTQAEAVAKVEV